MNTILKPAYAALLSAMILLAMTRPCKAEQYPKPTGYVNDFAHMLTSEQGAALNGELAAFEKKTTIEIAVVTVPGLNGQSVEEYARGLADEWAVGKRGQNNGIVFLIAPAERKMRIETASGAREVLTDSRADEIRDHAILPRFRAGDMAQGIIDGTHEIMRTLDADAAPARSGEEASAQEPVPQDSASYDAKVRWLFGVTIGLVLLLALVVPLILRSDARRHVLEKKRSIAARFAAADKTARHPDVKEEARRKLSGLKGDFSRIDRLTATSKGVKWLGLREKLDSMDDELSSLVSDMKGQIEFAERARKEGPELMKKIPGMIEAARKKLAKGEQSPEAAKYLKQAEAQYAHAQTQASGMTSMDWVVLYMLLNDVQTNISNAESAHSSESSSWSSSDSSSSSFGFGDSGGFGGGGGFDSGGGGSSGSW